jgi:uncharacterized protein (TIGR03492 family)
MAGRSVLLLSNGHGEDAVAARLARALAEARPDLELLAFPTVGVGRAFASAPVRRVGPLRALPSAGMTFRSVAKFADDLRAGLLSTTVAQIRALRAAAPSIVVSVGDVWAETLALLPRSRARYAVQTLVSVRMDDGRPILGPRVLRERITPVERVLLRRAFRRVYARDEETAEALRRQALTGATWLGNPMVDELSVGVARDEGGARRPPVVVLLPGSRDHADASLERMLAALASLGDLVALVPWARDEAPRLSEAWTAVASDGDEQVVRAGSAEVRILRNGFAEALARADLAIGTAGTAHEQAAGVGVPVIAFAWGTGYTDTFLAAQRRLLGDAVEVVAPATGAIASAVRRLLDDPAERRRRGEVGRARMGPPGASRAIARDILDDAADAGWLAPASDAGPAARDARRAAS